MNLAILSGAPSEASALRSVSSDFDTVINEGNVLVVFWSPHCRSCGELLHALASFALAQGDGLRVLAANRALQEALGDRFRVLTLPTALFFQHGQLLSVKVGPQSSEDLHDWLSPFLSTR